MCVCCVCVSHTKYPRFIFNNGRARDSFSRWLDIHILLLLFFLRCVSSASFSSLLFHSTHFDPRVPVYVHSKLRLYILFSIEIHHSLAYNRSIASSYMHTHTHTEYAYTNSGTAMHTSTHWTYTHTYTHSDCVEWAYACCHKEKVALHHSHTFTRKRESARIHYRAKI